MNHTKRASGQALIEFALFIPVLLICLLAALEFGNLYIQAQKISNLAREISFSAYRGCQSSDANLLGACITSTLSTVCDGRVTTGMIPNYQSNLTVILTVYDNSLVNPVRQTWQGSSGGFTSKLIATPPDPAMINIEGRLTVGEVFYRYSAVTPVNSILKLAGFPPLIYETVSY